MGALVINCQCSSWRRVSHTNRDSFTRRNIVALLCVEYQTVRDCILKEKSTAEIADQSSGFAELLVNALEQTLNGRPVAFPSVCGQPAIAHLLRQMNDFLLSRPQKLLAYEFMKELPENLSQMLPQVVSLLVYPKLLWWLGCGACLYPYRVVCLEMKQLVSRLKKLNVKDRYSNIINWMTSSHGVGTFHHIPVDWNSYSTVQRYLWDGLDASREEAAKCSLGHVVKFYDDLKEAYMAIRAERLRQANIVYTDLQKIRANVASDSIWDHMEMVDRSSRTRVEKFFKNTAAEIFDDLRRFSGSDSELDSQTIGAVVQRHVKTSIFTVVKSPTLCVPGTDCFMRSVIDTGLQEAQRTVRRGGLDGCMISPLALTFQALGDRLRETMEESVRRVLKKYLSDTDRVGGIEMESVLMWIIQGQHDTHLLVPLSAVCTEKQYSRLAPSVGMMSILESIRKSFCSVSDGTEPEDLSVTPKTLQGQLLSPMVAFESLHRQVDRVHLEFIKLLDATHSTSGVSYDVQYVGQVREGLRKTYELNTKWDACNRVTMPDGDDTAGSGVQWATKLLLTEDLHSMQLASQSLPVNALSPIRDAVFKCMFECLDKHDIHTVMEEPLDEKNSSLIASIRQRLSGDDGPPPAKRLCITSVSNNQFQSDNETESYHQLEETDLQTTM